MSLRAERSNLLLKPGDCSPALAGGARVGESALAMTHWEALRLPSSYIFKIVGMVEFVRIQFKE
jgi:hypothetical protein